MLTLCPEIKSKSEKKLKDPSPPLRSFSDIHVLAVDDSLIDRKVIERLLKTAAYKVTTADTAFRALEVLGVTDGIPGSAVTNALQINLILTDYCMPGMTGYDLLRKVKETSSLKEIPVIIMSTEDVPDRIRTCLADGAEEFILKPLRLADVKRLKVHVRPKTNQLAVTKDLEVEVYSEAACKDHEQAKTSFDVVDASIGTDIVCPKRMIPCNDVGWDDNVVKRPHFLDD